MSWLSIDLDLETITLITAVFLLWVALIHVLVASGLRIGELVWSGQQPRLLRPALRVRSVVYAVLLILSALVLAMASGLIEWNPIPDAWMRSSTFVVTAFLGVGAIYSIFWGSTWERMLFAPILVLGAVVAGWLTFG